MTGDVVWSPSSERVAAAEVTRFRAGLHPELRDAEYLDLWRWSVEHPDRFWSAIADFEDVRLGGAPAGPVAPDEMIGGAWFPGRTVNYAEHMLRKAPETALIVVDDDNRSHAISSSELRNQVAALAAALRSMGVVPGDRVAAVLPNRSEAVVGLLACATVGAIWSVCSPEFGTDAIVSRFAQLAPRVLIASDGYRHGGREHARIVEMAEVTNRLPGLERVIWVDHLRPGTRPDFEVPVHSWDLVTTGHTELEFTDLPFEHPLWVLFSSGTTGIPKGIVHGHGGVLLEHLKMLRIHSDVRAGDRYMNVASTAWVVWNMLVSGLGAGATVVLLDGSPVKPELGRVWQVAAEHRVDVMGLSAGYIHACLKADVVPSQTRLRTLQVTGSPLSEAGFDWVGEHFDDMWLSSMSGGTDIASIFVGGVPELPVRRPRLQAPALGVAVAAWDADGRPVIGEQGELVVTKPMPSMPLRFWNDPDDHRYRASYFDMFPGIWRHGDFIEFDVDGSSVIHGRSDSTLNRGGIRIGSAEIYRVVEEFPEVRESLVVGAELGADGYDMVLFVAAIDGTNNEALRSRIGEALRWLLSPRHVPDDIVFMRAIPHTRTGKKLEVPVKRMLQGAALTDVVDLGAVDDSGLLREYEDFAHQRHSVRTA
ncbi:acetoacetate--CoA ligase [Nocardia vinacea]|uniref:Acetoacetate--CoA ligase n=1 Tax=Nocardia vinacea TaxID=96468 RepID=A0ABZ1YRP8_9NOCA|nr:acetoacetate--CoA ligase [Nocardia vinacea]